MQQLFRRFAVCLTAILVLTQPLAAQSTEYQLAQIVTERKPFMFDLQTAYWVLFDLNKGKTTDYGAAAEAADSMIGIMDSFTALLLPGTAHGEAPGTRAKPEIWSDTEAFDAAVQNFKTAVAALSKAASTGDPAVYRNEFEAFTAACTGCHGLRPSSGGPFRFAYGE
jgi:cytochrome c556